MKVNSLYVILFNVIIYTIFIIGISIIAEWIVSFNTQTENFEDLKFKEYQHYDEYPYTKLPQTEEDYIVAKMNERLMPNNSDFKTIPIPKQVRWNDQVQIDIPYHQSYIIDNYKYTPSKKDYSTDSYKITSIDNYTDTYYSKF